jgi:hypothetical protein
VNVAPGRGQWPISVQVTVTKSDWPAPRTFDTHYTADHVSSYFTGEGTSDTALAEVAQVLAKHIFILIDEWLAIGPVPGIKEVTP